MIRENSFTFNGDYFEDLIDGYETINASGRELVGIEHNVITVANADGAIYKSRRNLERVIKIDFIIRGNGSVDVRSKIAKLSGLIQTENAKIVFKDESDKFLIGTISDTPEAQVYQNGAVGSFSITCHDPRKFSVSEYSVPTSTVIEDEGISTVFSVDYDGAILSHPIITAVMGTSASDVQGNGFIGFIDNNGNMLQFGEPDELEGRDFTRSETLKNAKFASVIDSLYNHTAIAKLIGGYVQTGTIKIANSMLCGSNMGTGASWHGSSATAALPTDSNGAVGSQNCTYTCRYRFQVSSVKQNGMLQILLVSNSRLSGFAKVNSPTGDPHAQKYYDIDGYDDDGNAVYVRSDDRTVNPDKVYYTSSGAALTSDNIVAGIRFYKTGTSKSAKADLYVAGVRKKTITFTAYGSNKTSNGTVKISKAGGKITFTLGGKNYSFSSNNITSALITKNSFYFGKYKGVAGIKYQGILNCSLVKNSVYKWEDIPNKFEPDDELTVDCDSGIVHLNSIRAPELGALGNDWEEFGLVPGTNQIRCIWSDWALNPPTFTMKYRKVWL